MRRREFIGLLGGAAAWPLVARAQQAVKVPRIGFLFYGSAGPAPEIEAFRLGLRELGYVEGQNIFVEYRFAGGQITELSKLADELVRVPVNAIVTPTTEVSVAAQKATGTIPIIFAAVADPLGAGLVSNLARPGGNITGFTSISAELGGKRLELLKAVAPKATRVAVLYNPLDRSNVLTLNDMQKSAPALGLTIQSVEARTPAEFDDAFGSMSRERADAIFGSAGVLTNEHRKRLVELAAKSQIPAMWGHRQFVDAGGLISYAANFYDQCRRAAAYVDQIIKGTKPGDLPVQQPAKFEFIINLKTARALGITVSPALLSLADEVIE